MPKWLSFYEPRKSTTELALAFPRGILLVGPPGTGKTLLARAVAGEAGVPFFSISASEFIELFVGVGASRVRDLFEKAKAAAPAIIFIDELDAVARSRGGRSALGTNDEREQTLNQLLVEMDGFEDRTEVIVLAAPNRPDVLDQALLRPGRFDRQVEVPLPDRQGRVGILRIHTRQLQLDPDVDLERLAAITIGFSGADLANLANEGALTAARLGRDRVTMSDFEDALDKVRLGAVRPLMLNEQDRRVTAYHEAGHTLAAWYTPYADPVDKVTIIPRGRALGVTEQIPGEDRYSYSRTYLMARLVVMLGGRTAEEVIFGDVTTGAQNDLTEATKLARRMVYPVGHGGPWPGLLRGGRRPAGYGLRPWARAPIQRKHGSQSRRERPEVDGGPAQRGLPAAEHRSPAARKAGRGAITRRDHRTARARCASSAPVQFPPPRPTARG